MSPLLRGTWSTEFKDTEGREVEGGEVKGVKGEGEGEEGERGGEEESSRLGRREIMEERVVGCVEEWGGFRMCFIWGV